MMNGYGVCGEWVVCWMNGGGACVMIGGGV